MLVRILLPAGVHRGRRQRAFLRDVQQPSDLAIFRSVLRARKREGGRFIFATSCSFDDKLFTFGRCFLGLSGCLVVLLQLPDPTIVFLSRCNWDK